LPRLVYCFLLNAPDFRDQAALSSQWVQIGWMAMVP